MSQLGKISAFTLMSFLSRAFADHARTRLPLPHAIPKNRLKDPRRGGRNLGNRYRVLEKSLRGKISLSPPQTATTVLRPRPAPSKVPMFKGFVVPIQPLPPQSDECCMSGCAICVYDLYEESLAAYHESVDTLRKKLTEMHIPEYQWPKHIQTSRAQPEKPTNVVMSAFEEMERRLKEKYSTQNKESAHLDTSGS